MCRGGSSTGPGPRERLRARGDGGFSPVRLERFLRATGGGGRGCARVLASHAGFAITPAAAILVGYNSLGHDARPRGHTRAIPDYVATMRTLPGDGAENPHCKKCRQVLELVLVRQPRVRPQLLPTGGGAAAVHSPAIAAAVCIGSGSREEKYALGCFHTHTGGSGRD